MAKSLWGDLTELAIVPTPKTILEEQASLLGEATGGMLIGVVEEAGQTRRFSYSLNVVVPALNNYTYEILRVSYPLEMYPVSLVAERPAVNRSIATEKGFEEAVENVLSSPEVRSVLSRLKSQIVKP
jgi:hypothetical protein